MPARTEETVSAPPPTLAGESARPKAGWRRAAFWIFASLLAGLVFAAGILATNWPFTGPALVRSLEQDSQAEVEIGPVHKLYFPHPGCVADNVVIHRDAASPKLTIRRLTILGSYAGMLHRYVPRVMAEGAVLTVPSGDWQELFASNGGQPPTNTSVGEIDADDMQVVMNRPTGDGPLVFDFARLTLRGVKPGSAVRFAAELKTPEPSGDLQLQGQMGPFRRDQAGSTPLAGTYTFENAKLEEFTGVGGVLSSAGKFNGQVHAINVEGATETPDFQLDVGIHPVDLRTRFHAVVNGTSGDLRLDSVESRWGETTVTWRGTIEGPSGAKDQKTVALDMVSSSARVQDLLKLFVHDEQPPMTGAISFRAHVTVPAGPEHFLRKLRLQGDFAIKDGKFASRTTQREIEILSARARGEADKIEDDQDRDRRDGTDTVSRDLQPVVATFQGKVVVRNGVAHFSELNFEVPGATAVLNGTYMLESQKIDAQGIAHMETKLSKATTGVKSFVLKVVSPLTQRHGNQGSTVGVHVSGTYGHPSFAIRPMKGGS